MNMKVEKVFWISRDAEEAEVRLSDGERVCVAFCQPCEYEEGALVDGPLRAFITKAVMLSRGDQVALERISDTSFAHKCVGRVVDVQQGLVEIGGFEIELDESIPAGASRGDLIDFECARLDLW